MRRRWVFGPVVLIALLLAWVGIWSTPDQRSGSRAPAPATPKTPQPRETRAPPQVQAEPQPQDAFAFLAISAENDKPLAGVRIEAPDGTLLATTGDNGAARVERNGAEQVEFVARKRGFHVVKGWAWWKEATRLVMKPGLTVAGRVLWAGSGAPVAGASVRIWDLDEMEEISGTILTDIAGRFDAAGVRANHPFLVVASLPGFGTARLRRAVDAPIDDLVLHLGGGGVLEGTVLFGKGGPAAGLEVLLLRPSHPIPPRRHGGVYFVGDEAELALFAAPRTRTDAAGRYEFRGVPLTRDLAAVARVSKEFDGSSRPFRFERDGQQLRRDIQLPSPASLRVIAKNGDGKVLPDVQVDLVNEREIFSRDSNALEPDDSRFFAVVTPARYTLRVWFKKSPHRDMEIVLRPGEDRVIEMGPATGGVVEGVVLRPGGEPVPQASVWWSGERQVHAQTDARGRFELTGLGVGPGTITVTSFFELQARTRVDGVVPGGRALRIVLEPGARLRGRIAGLPKGTRRIRCTTYSVSVTSGTDMKVDAKGSFERSVPAREPLVFTITLEGYPPIVVDVPAMAPGATRDLGTLRLDRGRTAHGRITDDTQNPVQGARVTIAEPWTDLDLAARSGKDGVFRFPRMPRRSLRLRIDARGFPVHFAVHETDGATITLGRGGLLDARLVGAGDMPLAGVDLWLLPAAPGFHPDRAWQGVKTDADGRLRWRLQQGRWRVRLWSEKDRKLLWREVEVRPGETTEVTLRFE